MRAFLEHLFWADKQYLEKHALYLFILLPGFHLTMGDMKVFLSSTFAFQICEIQIAWNHDVILTISPYSPVGYSSAVGVLCCIDNPLEKTSVTVQWVWWYMARRNAPQHEDITKDETPLTCSNRAVRSLTSVLQEDQDCKGRQRKWSRNWSALSSWRPLWIHEGCYLFQEKQ